MGYFIAYLDKTIILDYNKTITIVYRAGVNMEIRFNPIQLNSISAFVNIHSHSNKEQRQVYFVRTDGAGTKLLSDVSAADHTMSYDDNTAYCRLVRLESLSDPAMIKEYLKKNNDIRDGRNDVFSQYPELSAEIAEQLRKLLEQLHADEPNMNETAERNMSVQLLYRIEKYLPELLLQRKNKHCKLIYSGCSKNSEFLFGYLAAMLGIDTLILMPEGKGHISEKLLRNCAEIHYGDYEKVTFPEFRPVISSEKTRTEQKRSEPKKSSPVKLNIPPHPERKSVPATIGNETATKADNVRRERSYEELAALAESVVMIIILDETGEPVASGSGIAVHKDGYILTNCHVVQKSHGLCVRIENDDEIYDMVDIIKYHPLFDLALIRIDRKMPPLPVFDGRRQLRRGEKVFAIGSPMGLFNSVSDGIISGFRTINDKDMIQFTAPISHGSSGGALLNSYGEVIGICTSGIDEGQNLNLAVSYKQIRDFASNVIK